MVEHLLVKKPKMQCINGCTTLMWATQSKHIAAIEILAPYATNITNKADKTALDIAIEIVAKHDKKNTITPNIVNNCEDIIKALILYLPYEGVTNAVQNVEQK